MAIIIQNISETYSTRGVQTYIVKINNKTICLFTHQAEDGLAMCLAKAASAVIEAKKYETTSTPKSETSCAKTKKRRKTHKKD